MNVFELRQRVIDDYGAYVRSFISIRDQKTREKVDAELADGLLWPEPSKTGKVLCSRQWAFWHG